MNTEQLIRAEADAARAGAAYSERHFTGGYPTHAFRVAERTAAAAYAVTCAQADTGETSWDAGLRHDLARAFRRGGYLWRTEARRVPPKERLLREIRKLGITPPTRAAMECLVEELCNQPTPPTPPTPPAPVTRARPSHEALAAIVRQHDVRVTVAGSHRIARELSEKFDIFVREGS